MLRNEDVSFPAEGGIELSGWLFVPGEDGPLPAITMAHGYAWTKYHGIEPTAEAFAEAGFAVLLHDHRGFMDLGTTPRSQRKCSSRGASAPATSAAFPVVGGRSRDVAGPNDPGLAYAVMRNGHAVGRPGHLRARRGDDRTNLSCVTTPDPSGGPHELVARHCSPVRRSRLHL
jgi:hypothetical protein